MKQSYLFIGAFILAASGLVSPPVALAIGLAYGVAFYSSDNPGGKNLSKILLQASVVGLGFGMNLHEVVHAGRSGFLYTAFGITGSMIVGLGLGRLMKVGDTSSLLITAGTAICGGSAIAAVGPIAEASEEEMAVSLATIFVLNSVALLAFPTIGWAMHLTQTQFGLWSALAIHDTSSVVGAAAKYGSVALAVGMTVKLARALWIVPLSVATAVAKGTKTQIQWPWFILFFCLAAIANTYVPVFGPAYSVLSRLGKLGLTATLFLIGTGLSRQTLRRVGVRPLMQGIALWAVVAVTSLALIRMGWIRI
ncbi:MAG TPA: putative sulfate exporter family transporter [Candidatus Acidoferrum sp.]|nr:putative sulfate exporter family transporter [Candidatus Acidoferrum sp.]